MLTLDWTCAQKKEGNYSMFKCCTRTLRFSHKLFRKVESSKLIDDSFDSVVNLSDGMQSAAKWANECKTFLYWRSVGGLIFCSRACITQFKTIINIQRDQRINWLVQQKQQSSTESTATTILQVFVLHLPP